MRLRLKLSDVAEHCSNPKARCTALIGALAICVATLDNFAQQLGRLIQVLLGFVGVLNEAMVVLLRLAIALGHGLNDFEQAIGANFVGIAQAIAIAELLSALAVVGQCFRATDPPAESAFGDIVAPRQ
ncbi:hypothetical protein YH69_33895 (plasmid) [Pseudomonas aeruginosa]|nr:hypothetical protein YH69_33895 [Pseudomonas aeruginosa]OFC00122.1 hypothetical protein AN472_27650 [Pseudomonas aeruginosa]OFC31358.1 hypothetical protein AN464_27400 [Pseudomonas aeruginosa]